MPTEAQIREAVEGYVDSFNKQDREKFAGLFAENVVHYEPVGSTPNRGRDAVLGFFDGLFDVIDRVEFELKDLIVTGDEAAFVFGITAYKKDGGVVRETGIDTFKVDDAGLVTEAKGYHDAAHTQVTEA
ncbi:nuclear transport factor 2 family protein [Streptomyces sp. NBC_01304]|uniref:nuclear transport factor 2 family protein n=1 Tax=Streptomyces sp. NBC_01304 TaxID=2903818 RepID=UPI002E0E4E6D|nr:nuclear transport factor 2 family protein [Streptomyces sp. NBC_01304]